jgi:Na+/H+ antiporter NhaC
MSTAAESTLNPVPETPAVEQSHTIAALMQRSNSAKWTAISRAFGAVGSGVAGATILVIGSGQAMATWAGIGLGVMAAGMAVGAALHAARIPLLKAEIDEARAREQ